MSAAAWWSVAAGAWVVGAVAVALLVGRIIRLADQQAPTDYDAHDDEGA